MPGSGSVVAFLGFVANWKSMMPGWRQNLGCVSSSYVEALRWRDENIRFFYNLLLTEGAGIGRL